jgi:uncharacterized damage-inducible protein DinB
MSESEMLWKLIDTSMWELGEAFSELNDDDVWRRMDPKLLSIGEICLHMSYWQMSYFLSADYNSVLKNESARYYFHTIESPIQLEIGAEELYTELQRVQADAKAAFSAMNPDLDAQHPSRHEMTWRQILEYQTFHIPYHTGQIYSIRHLMGHETVDN